MLVAYPLIRAWVRLVSKNVNFLSELACTTFLKTLLMLSLLSLISVAATHYTRLQSKESCKE